MEENLMDAAAGFDQKEMAANLYSPLTLAFMGDAVFELLIRDRVVRTSNASVNKLNRRSSRLAKASAQAVMAEGLKDFFTEDELAVYKRGRNAHSATKAKNATTGDYRKATGLEAVFGYLYLKGDSGRIQELFAAGLDVFDKEADDNGKDA